MHYKQINLSLSLLPLSLSVSLSPFSLCLSLSLSLSQRKKNEITFDQYNKEQRNETNFMQYIKLVRYTKYDKNEVLRTYRIVQRGNIHVVCFNEAHAVHVTMRHMQYVLQ